jgi:hypothetical protein
MVWRSMLCVLGGLAAAGCGAVDRLAGSTRAAIGEESFAERCAETMQRAFPGGDIEVTQQTAGAAMTGGTAEVKGLRRKLPAGSPEPRDVAVECRFDHGVLTSFRWTAGPVR